MFKGSCKEYLKDFQRILKEFSTHCFQVFTGVGGGAGGARAGDGAGGVGAVGVGAAVGAAGHGGVGVWDALKHSFILLASAWRLHHITRFPFLCQPGLWP